MRVVATAALRDARNSRAFLEWVRATTGWTIEIISGLEEARLIDLGIVSSSRVGAENALLVDLGGGSCELTLSRKLADSRYGQPSAGGGALTNEFLKHDPPRKSELKRLEGFAATGDRARAEPDQIRARWSGDRHLGHCRGVGGRGRSSRTLQKPTTLAVTREMMRRIVKQITRLPLEQRRRIPGIGPRRAEIICAGAVVYAELLERCRLGGLSLLRSRFARCILRKWRRNTIAARAPAGRWNRSAGSRSSARWSVIEWI